MSKSTHFIGQPFYSQVINLLDCHKILQISWDNGGECYTKSFNSWSHLVVMLYAVIMRFDSLREIFASILTEALKLHHLGILTMPRKVHWPMLISDGQKLYLRAYIVPVYATYRSRFCPESRGHKTPRWIKRLMIIDSTTIMLFSNLIFKGVVRHSKTDKKKGGIKVHTVIHTNEGVPSDIKFTSAALNDSFMLRPGTLSKRDIVAMDRAYIDYDKFERLTQRDVIYVTKMKKNLRYKLLEDAIYQNPDGFMDVRIQHVVFTKSLKDGQGITHKARIITHIDTHNRKLISLLTNDMEFDPAEIIAIYRHR